jgi:hypothetical protein
MCGCLSVLKWSLLSNGHVEGEASARIRFGITDVEALVRCHIPLSLVSRSNNFVGQLLPLVLSLEGPLGMAIGVGH